MKIGFVTCVKLGFSCIETIYSIGGTLDLVITLEDDIAPNKSGRVYLDNFCGKHNIELFKCKNINDIEVIERLKETNIDLLFIIGWSQIAKGELLETLPFGCFGIHPTLLPEGRGRASIPWAIIKNLNKTGVTLFKLDQNVDTGEIIDQEIVPLSSDESATTLYNKINLAHISIIRKNWSSIKNKKYLLTPQNESKATYWPARRPGDGEITENMDVYFAERLVRAVTRPYPGAFLVENNKKMIIWKSKISFNNEGIKLKNGYLVPLEYEVTEC